MANYNKIILVGNLTRDPALKYLPSQMAVVEFGLAVNNKFKTKTGEERNDVMFIDCACFGKGGEVINQYCKKGNQLMVDGRIKLDVWEDKQGGGKRSKHTVVVENFQLMGGNRPAGGGDDGEQGGEEPAEPPARTTRTASPSQRPAMAMADNVAPQDLDESDIPFAWQGRIGQSI